jgi:hypothetical protein
MSMPMSAIQQETPQLQFALHYARMGWSVVPAHRAIRQPDGSTVCTCREGAACVSKGKHPAIGWTEHQKRCASEHEIRNWFTGYFAEYGVGIITGAVSGFFVVDVDTGPGKPGLDNINDLQFINGDLPHTVEARTGGGGRHILLKHPGPSVLIATNKNTPAPGIDIRGDGGFIVAAPSLHESGRFYLWSEHGHPKNTAIAEAPEWLIEMVRGVPTDSAASGPRAPSTGTGEIIRDQWGKVTDGRERHMIGIICGVIASLTRNAGALPGAEAVFAEAWPTYERTTRARGESLEADHRGQTLMRQRVGHMLRRAEAGRWRVRVDVPTPLSAPAGQAGQAPNSSEIDVYQTLDIAGLMALPPVQWLIDNMLTTDGFSIVYGPPGSLKTFLVLDQALHIVSGRPWHGRTVKAGKVLYVAGEGVRGIARRVKAWCHKHEVDHAALPFRLLPASVNLSEPANVKKLIRTAVAQMEEDGECVALVVIDTVARAIPGLDENSAQEMGLFVAAVEELKTGIACHLLGVHHSGKDETRGARGSNALLGAVDTMVKVKRDDDRLTVTIEKQKDDDEGEPIRLRTSPVEWMDGLKPVKSLVLVADEFTSAPPPPPPDESTVLLRQVAALLGENGRMITNKIASGLGLSGRKKQELMEIIPLLPDYATVIPYDNGPTVRLAKRRTGSGTTSPVEVVRYDVA